MVTWDPIRELERFQHELDHLFTGPSGTVHQYPSVNVWTTENEAYLTAELPGMEASDLDISVLGQKVTLSGKRQPREMNENERLHRRERLSGTFTRTLQMPFRVDAEKVGAQLENGVLTVTLPRAEDDKPKKISIQIA